MPKPLSRLVTNHSCKWGNFRISASVTSKATTSICCQPIDWEPSTRQQQDQVNSHAANTLYPRVMATKKHLYNLHGTHTNSSHIISHHLRKGGLSHGQIISPIAHTIDVGTVLQFFSAMETIKTSNGNFQTLSHFLSDNKFMMNLLHQNH